MIRRISIVLLLCVMCHFTLCVVFMDCGSKRATILNVFFAECNKTDERCAVVRGTNSTISVTLEPKGHIKHFIAKAVGIKNIIAIPFYMHEPLLCNSATSGLECPMDTWKIYTFKAVMYVSKTYPKDFDILDIRWEFRNKIGDLLLCIQFPGLLTDGNNTHVEF